MNHNAIFWKEKEPAEGKLSPEVAEGLDGAAADGHSSSATLGAPSRRIKVSNLHQIRQVRPIDAPPLTIG